MHNLHFIKVHANSGEEACKLAEQSILDFGNENNWRTMCGAVSQDNEVYNSGDGRYSPAETEYTTIEAINECVSQWIKGSFYGETARLKYERGETNIMEWDAIELWALSKWAEHLSEAHKFKDNSFNVLEDTFFSYKYDECGVSNNSWCSNEDDKLWIVFCDMHS